MWKLVVTKLFVVVIIGQLRLRLLEKPRVSTSLDPMLETVFIPYIDLDKNGGYICSTVLLLTVNCQFNQFKCLL